MCVHHLGIVACEALDLGPVPDGLHDAAVRRPDRLHLLLRTKIGWSDGLGLRFLGRPGLASIFSQTLGTPRNMVGRTSVSVSTNVPCIASGRANETCTTPYEAHVGCRVAGVGLRRVVGVGWVEGDLGSTNHRAMEIEHLRCDVAQREVRDLRGDKATRLGCLSGSEAALGLQRIPYGPP